MRRRSVDAARDRPRRRLHGKARGYSLVELLFVMGIAAVLTGAAVPQILAALDRSRARAATRFLQARMMLARAQAVGRSATVALRFDDGPDGITFTTFVDGNRNGVRARDIEADVDRQIEPPVRLGAMFPTVRIGLSPQMSGAEPVQLSSSNLLSFTPAGTASSGSIYVCGRDGTQFVVRVLGATARARVLQYDMTRREWVEVL